MAKGFFSRGFLGRRRSQDTALPPGQYLEDGFPVLSAGPTPRTPLEEWDFSIVGEIDEPKRWTWDEFRTLPSEEITKDIHYVTKWSKLGTSWEGVSVDTLLDGVETPWATTTTATPGVSSATGETEVATIRGRLTWRIGEVVETRPETQRAKSLLLEVSGWEGHKAGQHVDVRLTAEDGYQAQRSYSIASAPEEES